MQYFISFLEGIITFVSPCLLPMLPIYISYFAVGREKNTKKVVINALGFIFDGMQKSELFDAVNADGSLPRKTFSMGHADDKRFYIEARKIK